MAQNAIDKARVAELRLQLFGHEPVPTKAHEEGIARILAILFPDDPEDEDGHEVDKPKPPLGPVAELGLSARTELDFEDSMSRLD